MRRQSTHDRVLWDLASHGKMTRGLLRQHIGLKQDDLDIILAELEKEGRILRCLEGKSISTLSPAGKGTEKGIGVLECCSFART